MNVQHAKLRAVGSTVDSLKKQQEADKQGKSVCLYLPLYLLLLLFRGRLYGPGLTGLVGLACF